jgi:hypothetical protein
MSPLKLRFKNDCAAEGQQKFTDQTTLVAVMSYLQVSAIQRGHEPGRSRRIPIAGSRYLPML